MDVPGDAERIVEYVRPGGCIDISSKCCRITRTENHQRRCRHVGVNNDSTARTVGIQRCRGVQRETGRTAAGQVDRVTVTISTDNNGAKTVADISHISAVDIQRFIDTDIRIHDQRTTAADEIANNHCDSRIVGRQCQRCPGTADRGFNINIVGLNRDIITAGVNSRIDGLLTCQTGNIGGSASRTGSIIQDADADRIGRDD